MNQMTRYRQNKKNVNMPRKMNGLSRIASQIFMEQHFKLDTKEHQ